jgi:DNA invertase Pin-like site-specific DNA recombinase
VGKKRFGWYIGMFVTLGSVGGEGVIEFQYKNLEGYEYNVIVCLIDSYYINNSRDDRLYRDRKKLVDFLAFCRLYNTKVLSYNQKFLEVFLTMPPPFDEAMYDLMLQIIGWIAEEQSSTKSKRVKLAVRKANNGTFSHKGNKWGRKAFSKQTLDRVINLHKEGESLRSIASKISVYDKNRNARNISKSSVQKIISVFKAENDSKYECS